ncbi:MAG: hypothetical protein DSY40_02570, partial [Nautilia sp.]
MRKIFLLMFLAVISIFTEAKTISLFSPNKKIEVKIKTDNNLSYEVYYDGNKVINTSKISLTINDKILGKNPRLQKKKVKHISEVLHPVVKQKSAEIENDYNLLTLSFKGYDVQFVAYNDAIAWRFITHMPGSAIVNSELAEFNLGYNAKVWFPEEESMMTHQERNYIETE